MKDSDPEKWIYREHTRVKHEILEKYLRGWVPILGKYHKRICYFDGFAGRGEYEGVEIGTGSQILLKKQLDTNQLFKNLGVIDKKVGPVE